MIIEKRLGPGSKRRRQENVIGFCQELIKLRRSEHSIRSFRTAFGVLADGNHLHPECLGQSDAFTSDCAQTNHPQCCPSDLARTSEAAPEILLSPSMLLLESGGRGQSFGERENQPDGVLGNNRTVNFCGVGYADATCDQFGKQELMHGGGGGMNPSQLPGCFELLWMKLPSNQDFSISDLTGKFVQSCELDELVLWKFLL